MSTTVLNKLLRKSESGAGYYRLAEIDYRMDYHHKFWILKKSAKSCVSKNVKDKCHTKRVLKTVRTNTANSNLVLHLFTLFFGHPTKFYGISAHSQFDTFFQTTILTSISVHSINNTALGSWTLIINIRWLATSKKSLKKQWNVNFVLFTVHISCIPFSFPPSQLVRNPPPSMVVGGKRQQESDIGFMVACIPLVTQRMNTPRRTTRKPKCKEANWIRLRNNQQKWIKYPMFWWIK